MSLSLKKSCQAPSTSAGHTRVHKPRRRRNGREQSEAASLEAELVALQNKYSSTVFFDLLQDAIVRAHAIATRDARRYRDDVFHAIDVGGCRTLEEIVDDLSLTRWVVEPILLELAEMGLVEMREEPAFRRDPAGGAPRMEFHPHHTAPGSNFFLSPDVLP